MNRTFTIKRKTPKRNAGRRRGITILETALVLPILLLITLGMVQFGIIMDVTNTLTSLSRAGARYAAIHQTEGTPAEIDAKTRAFIRKRATGTIILAGYSDPQQALPDSWITITGEQREDPVTKKIIEERSTGKEIRVDISYPLNRKLFLQMFSSLPVFSQNYLASEIALVEGIG